MNNVLMSLTCKENGLYVAYVYVDVLVCQDKFSYQGMGFPAVM